MNEEKPDEMPEKKSGWQSFWEMVRFAILALLIVVPIRAFVAEPFIVSGSSMVPTFEDGDYLVIDKISYALGNPERYDVTVFRFPGDPSKFYIKRIIGLPNETVDIEGNVVTITNEENPEGFVLNQPFVKNPSNSQTHLKLKGNEYFVMGDNRQASSDSRSWGAVDKDLLTGRALVRLLPFNQINILPGNYQIEE
ncbi:MAG: signal peptidase I [bacterium]|nr:signal peptidase I [bacterium]